MLGVMHAEGSPTPGFRSQPIHRTKAGTPYDLSKLTRKRGIPPYERLRNVHGMLENPNHSFQSVRVTGILHS